MTGGTPCNGLTGCNPRPLCEMEGVKKRGTVHRQVTTTNRWCLFFCCCSTIAGPGKQGKEAFAKGSRRRGAAHDCAGLATCCLVQL